MSGYGKCPRCGTWTLEHLKSYSHCWECNFVPDETKKTPKDFERARRHEHNRFKEELMLRSMMLVRGIL